MKTPSRSLRLPACTAAAVAALVWPASLLAATKSVDEHRPADATGEVEISNVAGRVEVIGWDKPEVAVTGQIGSGVERVDVTSAGSRTTVHVEGHEWHGLSLGLSGPGAGEANLVVHIPARSSLTAGLISADLNVTGIAGDQRVHSVSGDITTAAQHEVHVRTVSGDVHVTAGSESKLIEIATVSGDLAVSGGAGELSVETVSGDGTLSLGTLSRAHLKTVSGDISLSADLTADGRLEAESISGDMRVSFSGDVTTCFGRKAAREGFGPGSRLNFQEGAASARVRIVTKSGDVTLCGKK